MSQPIITVEDLSKRYLVGHHSANGERYTALRDVVSRHASSFLRKTRDLFAGRQIVQGDAVEEFWALKDVSFDVHPGEAVGVIGRNGAGKSTLLKILSRITEPSRGRVRLRGRVASLLEVGTGFHPELTGRENVYLNGAILGMTRAEIRRRFDEIVAFAEVERFIDTPVKRYSSGMYVRLAFAVSAHLEPEILLVDEVLSVGDLAFQHKCMGKMRDAAESGKTVLFVSHNLGSLVTLCQHAIWIDNGSLIGCGECSEQVSKYIRSLRSNAGTQLVDRHDRSGSGIVRLSRIYFKDGAGELVDHALSGTSLQLFLEYIAPHPLANVAVHVAFYNDLGTPVTYLSSSFSGDHFPHAPDSGTLVCTIPEVPLTPGNYLLNVCIQVDSADADHISGAANIDIVPGSFFPTGKTPPASHGHVLCKHSWSLAHCSSVDH